MPEEDESVIRPIRSEYELQRLFDPVVGKNILAYRAQRISLVKLQTDEGQEVMGLGVSFVGDAEDSPSVVCTLPYSTARHLREMLDKLLA